MTIYVIHLERKIFRYLQIIVNEQCPQIDTLNTLFTGYESCLKNNKKKETEKKKILKKAKKTFLTCHFESFGQLLLNIRSLQKLWSKTKKNCYSQTGTCGSISYPDDDLWPHFAKCTLCRQGIKLSSLEKSLVEWKDYYLFSKIKYLFLFKYLGNFPEMKQTGHNLIPKYIYSFLIPRFDLLRIKTLCYQIRSFFHKTNFEKIFPWYPKLNYKPQICVKCYEREDSPYRGTRFLCEKCHTKERIKKNK